MNKLESNEIDGVFKLFKSGYSAITNHNWSDIIKNFLNSIPTSELSMDFSKRIICGWLAALCEKSYYLVAHQKSDLIQASFRKKLLKLIDNNRLPRYIFQDGPVLCGKKQPAFAESITYTLDRFKIIELLHKKFKIGVKAIVIGGSMSYGAFYSVRGNIKEGEVSDIDGLVIVDDSFFESEELISPLGQNSNQEIFLSEEVENFVVRLKIFKKLFREGKADIISHRFSIKGKDFDVSLHFFPLSVFADITVGTIVKSLNEGTDSEYVIRNFRTDSFTHPCMATNSFIATTHETSVTGREVRGGYITNMPGYSISKGVLFPGAYHIVIYPSFLVLYDKDGLVTKYVKEFEKTLYLEVKKQQVKYPFSTYNKGHNRYDIFAPGRYEEGNNSFIHPKYISRYQIPTNVKTFIKKPYINGSNIKRIKTVPSSISKIKSLAKWKQKTLKLIGKGVKKFRQDPNSFILLKSLKKDGKSWYTVMTATSMKKEYTYFKNYFLESNSEEVIIGVIEQENILPKDLLKLKEYNELSKIFGRVFVSATYDVSDQEKRYPTYLSLVIRT